MKKRAQTPDAHTYTILFRGLAANANYPLALTKALSIYHSMDAPNSPVRPSTIHTNAVLQVCARAGDMDAMFGIAAKLKRKGLRSPNNLTFTIILNAIRQDAYKSIINGEINEEALNKAIIMARRMWDDIITRWRQGDIWIDEELVCSMGRILLLGKMVDVDDIFSLIEQTMQVPRILPGLGTPEREKIEPSLQAKVLDLESSVTDGNSTGDLSPSHEFRVVTPPKPPSGSLSAYAKPGPNTISLVLEALFKLRQRYPLRKYWDIFTKGYGVQPDSQNFHSYLRNLRLFRASKEVVEMLQQMPAPFFAEKTFRIALSACRRDKNNANSMSNAEKILDIMEEKLPHPDFPALQFYLDVVVTSPDPPNNLLTEKQHHESNYTPKGAQIKQALNRLNPYFANIKSILADNEKLLTIMDVVQANKYRESAVELARDMIGAYDRLINHVMADKRCHGGLIAKRKDLASFVTKYNYMQIKPKIGRIPRGLQGEELEGRVG
jgi:Pentatricopeptide repeat domain